MSIDSVSSKALALSCGVTLAVMILSFSSITVFARQALMAQVRGTQLEWYLNNVLTFSVILVAILSLIAFALTSAALITRFFKP